MGKYYYIDGENVGAAWSNHGLKFFEDDIIYVFSSRDSQKVPQKFIAQCKVTIRNIIVDTKGHNCLDILMAGIIGTEATNGRQCIIISNDKGFQVFISYFVEKYGCSIRQIKIPEIETHIGKIKNKVMKIRATDVEKERIITLLDKYQCVTRYRKQ